jgi:hypothetical protein
VFAPLLGRTQEVLTIDEARKRTEVFLISQMIEGLRAIQYNLPSDAMRSRVKIRHVRGVFDATYLVQAFDDELLMQLRLNMHRLVVVYRVPARGHSMSPPWHCVWNVGVIPGLPRRGVEGNASATPPRHAAGGDGNAQGTPPGLQRGAVCLLRA